MSDNQTPATQADSAIDNATEHTTHFGFKQVDKGRDLSIVHCGRPEQGVVNWALGPVGQTLVRWISLAQFRDPAL